ncbi:hypothetical protein pipiens_009539 [Culex pipiens pipiens]|uniref:Ionotropic receptor n=1 Tax=Culex pipiens pipiens TaxID=38569 RepID=A0ABD1DDG5_CULPP
MVTAGQFLVLLTLCIGITSSTIVQENNPYHKILANYTVTLIEYLASQQSGNFDCWLHHACSDPPGNIRLLKEIYVGLEQKSISRLAIDSRFNWTKVAKVWRQPVTTGLYERNYLDLPLPFDNVFLAPAGRSLNIAELFLRPFQTELWIVFFIGMIAVKVVFLLVPNSFKNDPLLLPICGFERYDLNQAGRNEKLVMLSLIVLFFFISNAYETKIISLMSSKPRVTLVTTLQDILDSGTVVKAERLLASQYPMFGSVYIYLDGSDLKVDQLDGTSVYLANGIVGSLIVERSINWDYESNQPRYRIMAEKLAMGIGFYPIPFRTAIKHHLSFVQRALFEAGFLVRWRLEWIANINRHYSTTLPGGVNPTADILVFSDLIPAWFIALSGIALSSVFFVAELFYARMQSHTPRIFVEA